MWRKGSFYSQATGPSRLQDATDLICLSTGELEMGASSDVLVRHTPVSWSEGSWLLGVWIVHRRELSSRGTWECQTSWWCGAPATPGTSVQRGR